MNFSAWSIHRPLPAILVFILLTAAGLVGQEVKVATERLELGADKARGEVNLEHAAGKLALVIDSSLS